MPPEDGSGFNGDNRDSTNIPEEERNEVSIEELNPDSKPGRFFGTPENSERVNDVLREATLTGDFELALEEVFPNQSAEYIIRTEGRKIKEENGVEYEHSQGIIDMIKIGDIIVDKFTSSSIEGRVGHIQSVDQVREIMNRSGIEDSQFLIKIAKAFYHLGQFDRSYYVVSERLIRSILDLEDNEISILDKADTVNLLGALMGKYDRHAEQYKINNSALAIVQNAFGGDDIEDEILGRHSDIKDREDDSDPINAIWLEQKLRHGIAFAQSNDENISDEEVIGKYKSCLESRQDINNNELIGRTKLDIARVYLDNGHYSEALEVASEAFEGLQEQQYHRKVPDALEIIEESLENMDGDRETIVNLQKLREQEQGQIEPDEKEMQNVESEKTEGDLVNPTRSLIQLPTNIAGEEDVFLVKKKTEDAWELPKHDPQESRVRSLLDELQEEFETSLSRSKSNVFPQGSKKREAGNDLKYYKIELQNIENLTIDKIAELGYVEMKFDDISDQKYQFDSESQDLIEKESNWRAQNK